MPRMNGLELQGRLREMDIDIPIIFISGSVEISMAVQAIKEGAVDFLQKHTPSIS